MHAGSDKDRMTTLFPVFFNSRLAFRPRGKPRATTEKQLTSSEATQALLLVGLTMAWLKPCNMQVFHQNVLLLPMLAATCKELRKWLMHDRIWLPQLQALTYKRNLQLSETFCFLIHRSILVQRMRNPELRQVAWKIARMVMQSDIVLVTNVELYSTFYN